MLPGFCGETLRPGCEPRELFPHWSFTSGSSSPPDWPPRRTPGLWANLTILQPEGGSLESGSCGGEGRCGRKKLLKISRAVSRSGSGASERKANRAVRKRSSEKKSWIHKTFPDTLRKTSEGHYLWLSPRIFSTVQVTGMWALRRVLLHISIETHQPFYLLILPTLVPGQG